MLENIIPGVDKKTDRRSQEHPVPGINQPEEACDNRALLSLDYGGYLFGGVTEKVHCSDYDQLAEGVLVEGLFVNIQLDFSLLKLLVPERLHKHHDLFDLLAVVFLTGEIELRALRVSDRAKFLLRILDLALHHEPLKFPDQTLALVVGRFVDEG